MWKNAGTIAAALAAFVPALYPVYSLVDTRRLEARRPLLELQFDLYQEAVAVASRLGTVACEADDPACVQGYLKDCQRFLDLYWGQLAIVEDRRVEQAMIAFRRAFKERHEPLCAPEQIHEIATRPKTGDSAGETPLAHRSLRLAHCVNASLQISWGVDLLPERCPIPEERNWWSRLVAGDDAEPK
jgi:hypothetical protein